MMEEIALSGILVSDADKRTDKKGHEYVRFKVGCEGTDLYGKPKVTLYRCYTYDLKANNLKNGDMVFLTGALYIETFEGRATIDVHVHTIVRGVK